MLTRTRSVSGFAVLSALVVGFAWGALLGPSPKEDLADVQVGPPHELPAAAHAPKAVDLDEDAGALTVEADGAGALGPARDSGSSGVRDEGGSATVPAEAGGGAVHVRIAARVDAPEG